MRAFIQCAIAAMLARKHEIGTELTRQMGRPVRYTPMEVERMCERAEAMMALAPEGLADVTAGARQGFTRFTRKQRWRNWRIGKIGRPTQSRSPCEVRSMCSPRDVSPAWYSVPS